MKNSSSDRKIEFDNNLIYKYNKIVLRYETSLKFLLWLFFYIKVYFDCKIWQLVSIMLSMEEKKHSPPTFIVCQLATVLNLRSNRELNVNLDNTVVRIRRREVIDAIGAKI